MRVSNPDCLLQRHKDNVVRQLKKMPNVPRPRGSATQSSTKSRVLLSASLCDSGSAYSECN